MRAHSPTSQPLAAEESDEDGGAVLGRQSGGEAVLGSRGPSPSASPESDSGHRRQSSSPSSGASGESPNDSSGSRRHHSARAHSPASRPASGHKSGEDGGAGVGRQSGWEAVFGSRGASPSASPWASPTASPSPSPAASPESDSGHRRRRSSRNHGASGDAPNDTSEGRRRHSMRAHSPTSQPVAGDESDEDAGAGVGRQSGGEAVLGSRGASPGSSTRRAPGHRPRPGLPKSGASGDAPNATSGGRLPASTLSRSPTAQSHSGQRRHGEPESPESGNVPPPVPPPLPIPATRGGPSKNSRGKAK
jgi:hypothetical protein